MDVGDSGVAVGIGVQVGSGNVGTGDGVSVGAGDGVQVGGPGVGITLGGSVGKISGLASSSFALLKALASSISLASYSTTQSTNTVTTHDNIANAVIVNAPSTAQPNRKRRLSTSVDERLRLDMAANSLKAGRIGVTEAGM